MQFAETYPTKAEVSNALDTFGSWRQIIAKGLPKARRDEHDVFRKAQKLFDRAIQALTDLEIMLRMGELTLPQRASVQSKIVGILTVAEHIARDQNIETFTVYPSNSDHS